MTLLRPISGRFAVFFLASLAACAGAGADGPLAAGATRAALERLAAACSQVKTLQVSFRQEKHLAIFPKPVTAEGRIYYRQPAAIRFETTRPFHSVAIVNAEHVAKYERQGGLWRRLKLGNPFVLRMVLGQMAAWLRGDLGGDDREFTISGRQAGKASVLVITPKQAKSRQVIDHLELTLAPDGTRVDTVRIVESPESFTIMHFVDEERNVTLAEGAFATDLPSPTPARVEP
jgi:outer membrane lipoprotein-sorting protein